MMPILMVDDSREDLALATRLFFQCKILNPLRIMHSGQECLDYFGLESDRAAGTLPCIVLVDLVMKPISGIDVLRKLRDHPAAQGSTLIMLSGASDYTMVREGYQLGAATFVTKPLTCDELLRTFKNLRGVSLKSHSDGRLVVPTTADERTRARERSSAIA